jgi:uncharacterized protein involved in outer membrane biogenesis
VVADSWLESSGGRQMLQRELTRSLGLPVRLEGNYQLKLFPRLKIDGSGLEINQPGNSGVLALGQEYSAVIELVPFFHREVRITSIGLHGGFVDFSRAPDEAVEAKEASTQQISLPQVAVLEISDFAVRLTKEDSILIRQLQLRDFQPGKESIFDIDAALISGQAESARLNLHGGLTMEEGSFSTQLRILGLTLKWGESVLAGLTGEWEWDQPASRLTGHMAWQQTSQSAALRLQLAFTTPPSGFMHAQYHQQGLPEPSSFELDFSVLPDRLDLRKLGLKIAGQSIGGDGCLLLTGKTALHLSLQAGHIDLDRIYSLLPAQQGNGPEPPLLLAIQLHADKAWLAGAEASDVTVEIGSQPDCGLAPVPKP